MFWPDSTDRLSSSMENGALRTESRVLVRLDYVASCTCYVGGSSLCVAVSLSLTGNLSKWG